MNGALVVGVDAGGTGTRCVAAGVDGAVLARGAGPGANQRSSGGRPAAALAVALRAAVAQVDPGRVVAGVVGVAGAGSAGRAAAHAAAGEAWRAAGLGGAPAVVTDLEVAFAAGTPAGSGRLLLAGTGAVAAALVGGVVVHRCDGYGWLLGDDGGAVWLGRQAVRAVLAALDGRAPPTALTDPVTTALLGTGPAPVEHAQALIAAVYGRPPAELGRLAPVVSAAAHEGDPAACRIVATAADRMLAALAAVSRVAGPVVLAGSVLLGGGPVREAVLAGVRERHGVEPVEARDGAAGAAALALARWQGRPVTADVHARLTAG